MLHHSFLHIFFTFAFGIASPLFAQKTALLIDSDTANEVDDLFAIVRAIKAPEFNLVGISSSQFHTSPYASKATATESLLINKELMTLLKSAHIPLTLGSNAPLQAIHSPQISEAAHFIISQAHLSKTTLHIAILGPATNIASALLLDPSIASKIKVFYLGFWHNTHQDTFSQEEFNSRNDPFAINFLLNHPTLDLSIMTATTSQHLVFQKTEALKHLRPIKGVGEYLLKRWNTYNRWWTDTDPKQTQWIMWDLALISALAHPEWTETQHIAFPSSQTKRSIKVFTKIDAEQMTQDFWRHLTRL